MIKMASKLVNVINLPLLEEFKDQMQGWVRDQIESGVGVVYDVALDSSGSVSSVDPDLDYSDVADHLTTGDRVVFLAVSFDGSVLYIPPMQVFGGQNGPIKFCIEYVGSDSHLRGLALSLSPQNILTAQHWQVEVWAYKVQDIVANKLNSLTYPSTKAVFDQFQRKPVEVWRAADDSSTLKAIQADLSASPAWQLTDLDLTPYKRIKIYSKCGQKSGSTASASTTPAIVLEMLLDSSAAISAYGGNYCGSVMVQKSNDSNRLATLTCAVSADKTKFVVLRQTNLYGTAATSNNDVNADVFLIEGYYD